MNEVIKTIYEAVGLVVIVVLLFLQTWRASIIPIIAIPVSLIGTFAVLAAFGFSLNNLSLFGLVLAIGIVVDDAIVVVENVERNLRAGMSPREAAHKTMDEVGGALVAIALVLAAVFIPAAFITGISGQFFRQFAVTIAAATGISLLVSLTLSPALCAMLFKPHVAEKPREILPRASGAWLLPRLQLGLRQGRPWLWRADPRLHPLRGVLVLLVYAGLVALTVWQFGRAPTGFIPPQDQGYLITVVQLPPGASLARTDAVIRQATKIMLGTKGVAHVVPFAGLDGATLTNASNAGAIFTVLKPFAERAAEGLSAPKIIGRSAGAAGRDPGRLHDHHLPAAGARHRQCRRLQDDGGGPARARTHGAQRRGPGHGRRRQPAAGARRRLLGVQHQHAQDLCQHRPRAGRDAAGDAGSGVRDPGGLSRLRLCQ